MGKKKRGAQTAGGAVPQPLLLIRNMLNESLCFSASPTLLCLTSHPPSKARSIHPVTPTTSIPPPTTLLPSLRLFGTGVLLLRRLAQRSHPHPHPALALRY